MKGIYVDLIDLAKEKTYIGVKKKIKGQIEGFKELNVNILNISLENDYIMLDDRKTNFKVKGNCGNFKRNKSFFDIISNNFEELILQYDFIYIRYTVCNIGMLNFIKKFNKYNKKIFIEIPTYPYDVEYDKNLKNLIILKLDKLILRMDTKNIYRIVLTNNMNKLYSSCSINIFNGIRTKDIASSNFKKKLQNNRINIIAVANISKWHGYDRVIYGLKDYYSQDNNEIEVYFYIVGDGSDKENLESLTNKLKLNNYVKFLGLKYGNELDEIFSQMDIGASSLALFRAGGGHDPIKSKEYVAKGLPVLLGYSDRALLDSLPFVFRSPSDDSAVDISKLVIQYKEMQNKITKDDILNYAYNNLTWKIQMKKIIDIL